MGETDLLSSKGNDTSDPLGEPARERLRSKRGRQAKVSGSASAMGTDEAVSPTQEQIEKLEQLKKDLQELYDPISWQRVATFPLDVAQFVTGAPEFEASEQERQMLGADMALTIRFWAGFDPKYLVLLRLGLNWCSVMATHWIMYRARIVREELAERNR